MILYRCPECGRGGIAPRSVDRVYVIDGRRRTVRGVMAQVCPHCMARYYDLEALAQIDRALGLGSRKRGRRSAE